MCNNSVCGTQPATGGASQSFALYSWSVPWPSCPYWGLPAVKSCPLQSQAVKSMPQLTWLQSEIFATVGDLTSSAGRTLKSAPMR